MSIFNFNICIKNKTFITQRVIFRFFSNLRRLNIKKAKLKKKKKAMIIR